MNFIEHETAEKLRGGYYTPLDLATFLARWVAVGQPREILEPSCGDGAFLTALAAVAEPSWNITAFELDPPEAAKAQHRATDHGLNAIVHSTEFLEWALQAIHRSSAKFDAIVGNPPFIRYQYLPSLFQETAAQIFAALDCRFTKHTNAWVPFILASVSLLRPGGRLAMVVPAEILHVLHAQSLRTFLGHECKKIVIVDPEEIWFTDTLQGAVLLLAEKRADAITKAEGVGIVSVRGRGFLKGDPEELFNRTTAINGRTVEGKWTRALLEPDVLDMLDAIEELPSVQRFRNVADVDVGIVTGANRFFLVDDLTVQERGLQPWVHPMFGRSSHSPGVVYDEVQHAENARSGYPTNFVWLKGHDVEHDVAARAYIEDGERQLLHKRFKCRVRKPWYTVPSVYASEVGMLKRAHDAPRLILNRMRAFTTDTAYRIRPHQMTAASLVGAFVNPLTALSCELEGRTYGGGVLELVPSEIERVLLPRVGISEKDVAALDHSIRTRGTGQTLADYGAGILQRIGLSASEARRLYEGWSALRLRRQRAQNLESSLDEAA